MRKLIFHPAELGELFNAGDLQKFFDQLPVGETESIKLAIRQFRPTDPITFHLEIGDGKPFFETLTAVRLYTDARSEELQGVLNRLCRKFRGENPGLPRSVDSGQPQLPALRRGEE